MTGFDLRRFQAAQRAAAAKERGDELRRARQAGKAGRAPRTARHIFGARPSRKRSRAGRATAGQNTWTRPRPGHKNGTSPPLLVMIHGGSLTGLQYGENQQGAIHLDSNLLADTPLGREREMAVDALLHPRVNVTNLFVHWSISLDPALLGRTEAEWKEIARRHLQKCGFAGCMHNVALHPKNADHGEHIHVVASRSKPDGKLVSMSHGRWRFRAAVREIEQEFGMAPVDRPADREQAPTTTAVSAQRRAVRRSEADPWVSPEVLRHTLTTATSLEGYTQALAAKGVIMALSRNKAGTVTTGVTFRNHNSPTALAGSSISRDLSLPEIQRQIELNRQALVKREQAAQRQRADQQHRQAQQQSTQRPRER